MCVKRRGRPNRDSCTNHRRPCPVILVLTRVSKNAPGCQSDAGVTYKEGESLLEFRDLLLGQRIGLWWSLISSRSVGGCPSGNAGLGAVQG